MSSASHISTDDAHDDEFVHFYQMLKFRENDHNKIDLAHVKRTKLLLNHLESKQFNDRPATHWLLNEDLDEYAKVVDDKSGLNNYAEYIKSLCTKSLKPATGYTKWTSKLENCDNIEPIIRELSLDKKTLGEEEADMTVLQNWRSKMQKYDNFTEPVSKSVTESTKNVNRPVKQSTFQMKKPSTFVANSFNPATSFSSMVTPQERNNIGAPVFDNKRSINEVDTSRPTQSFSGFKTAKTELNIQNMKKYGNQNPDLYQSRDNRTSVKRSLGSRSRSVNSKFVPPIKSESAKDQWNDSMESEGSQIEDERLKGLDPKMIELICNEIMDHGSPITWDDISGLDFAKKTIQEIVVWPLLRPDIFTGLRRPPKGILLFGPPGTGKTLIGKCIASQSSSTFFSISASSLTSKWIGESEKLVRTLFSVARCHQPAVIFIDEIDSLLSQRNENEHESSRRIKTEFLVQLDGATTHEDDRILVIGATNRPQELDEAARRRLVKRLYIPLPEFDARRQIVQRLMSTERNELSDEDMNEIAKLTDGYSGADMKNLCQEASLEPIRSIDFQLITSIETREVRAVTLNDFISALKVVRSSVSPTDLNQYLEWDKIYGSRGT